MRRAQFFGQSVTNERLRLEQKQLALRRSKRAVDLLYLSGAGALIVLAYFQGLQGNRIAVVGATVFAGVVLFLWLLIRFVR